MKRLKEIFGGSHPQSETKEKPTEIMETQSHYRNIELHQTAHSHPAYYCPMKCEGDKVYKLPGNCPVCNMKLVPAGEHPAHRNQHNCC